MVFAFIQGKLSNGKFRVEVEHDAPATRVGTVNGNELQGMYDFDSLSIAQSFKSALENGNKTIADALEICRKLEVARIRRLEASRARNDALRSVGMRKTRYGWE